MLSCVTNIRTKRKPGTNPALIHTKHTKGYLLPDPPTDLRQEMTMAAPQIVSIVYGIVNPMRLSPKIRQAPPIRPITKTKIRNPMMVPTKREVLPFAFSISLDIALILFL